MRSTCRTVGAALWALVAMTVAVSGCSSPQGADPASLEGFWVLESFGAARGLTPADPEVSTQMALAAGTASGNGGVNSFTSTYRAPDAGEVSFGPVAATRMAGPAPAMEQEAAFFDALESTARFEINEGNLVLSDLGNNTLVVLAPGTAPTPSTGLPAPVMVEPDQASAEARVGDSIVFVQPDPANTTISTDNPDVLDLIQGSDDGSAQFNPAATAKAPGVAVVTISASDGSTSLVTVTVR